MDREQRDRYSRRQNEVRRKNRVLWIEFINNIGYGKCSICGYNKCFDAIDFHHIDPRRKEVEIGQVIKGSFIAPKIFIFLEEIDKCLAVCANCHREIHNKQKENDHE